MSKTEELRRILDKRGIVWKDCPERAQQNANGRGLTLPATQFWCSGVRYLATEQVDYYIRGAEGMETVTGMRFEVEPDDMEDFVARIAG